MTDVYGPDPDRGHIAIRDGGFPLATACDMGPYLSLWTYTTVHLSPASARDLAAALTAWADRHHDETSVRDPDEAMIEAIERTAR